MKDKVLTRVKVPATLDTYEFLIPYDMTVEQGCILMARIVSAREPARYKATGDADLMYLEGANAGLLVNPNETFRNLVLEEVLVEGSLLALV